MITLFGCAHFFNFGSFLLYPTDVKRLKCAMLGAFTVSVNQRPHLYCYLAKCTNLQYNNPFIHRRIEHMHGASLYWPGRTFVPHPIPMQAACFILTCTSLFVCVSLKPLSFGAMVSVISDYDMSWSYIYSL